MTAPTREDLAAREAEIQELLKQEKRDEAKKILLDLVVNCAQNGDIKSATRLRDQVYEVDPMALSDIIKVNEIIDEAMSGSVDDNFVQAWSELHQALTEEEFLALYHALEKHQVGEGKTIAKAGSKIDAVFFINMGHVNVNCVCGDKSVTIKTLEPGTMFGENCLKPSLWTVSLVSLSPVQLSVLRMKDISDLFERFAGLENKLTVFYEKFDNVPQLLEEQGEERRRHERSMVDHKMTFQVRGKDGKVDERTFRGELDNISQGGLAFLMRIVNRENRRAFFGRQVIISLQVEDKKLQFSGEIVAVTIHDFQNHDYALHVAFDKPVLEEIIRPLIPAEPDEEDEFTDQEMEADDGGEVTEG